LYATLTIVGINSPQRGHLLFQKMVYKKN